MLQRTGGFTARQVRFALNVQPTDTVLELGCDVGHIGREILPHCARWVGADISSNMLRVARRRLASFDAVEFVKLDRTELTGVEDARFDKAYSVAVFCDLDKEDIFLYLQELNRALKPGGWLYFETWNLSHPVGWKRWEYEVRNWAHSAQDQRKDVARNQFMVPEEVELLARNAGFEIGALYVESAWVQAIAIKPGADSAVDLARAYLRENETEIANPPQFSECFSKKLDLLYGSARPRDVLVWLNAQPQTDIVELYRDYLSALWARHQGRWGPPPNQA